MWIVVTMCVHVHVSAYAVRLFSITVHVHVCVAPHCQNTSACIYIPLKAGVRDDMYFCMSIPGVTVSLLLNY